MNRLVGLSLFIGAATICSFFLGRLSVSIPPDPNKEHSLETETMPEARPAFTIETVNSLLAERPTKNRALAVRAGILALDLNQLDQLWIQHFPTLDFNNGNDFEFAVSLLSQLADLDPHSALEKALNTGAWKNKFVPEVLAGWAGVDSEAAVDWSLAQNSPRLRQRCLAAIIDQIGLNQPQEAVDLFLSLNDAKHLPAHRWNAWDLFSRWAQNEPKSAIKQALRIHNLTDDRDAIRATMDAWGRFDGEQAASWINESMPDALKDEARIAMVAGWAETNPKEAGQFALTLKDEEVFAELSLHVLDGWTHNSFLDAATWIEGVSDRETRSQLQKTLVERSQRNADREPALEYALHNLDSNPDLFDAIIEHTHDLAMRDPDGALEWAIDHLQSPDHLNRFHIAMMDQLSRHRPEEASKFVSSLPAKHVKAKPFYSRTANHWARNDPESALQWLESLPSGELQEAALLGYAEGWMTDRNELNAAGKWIDSLPRNELHDKMVSLRAKAHMNIRDIDRSIEIAQQIEEPFLRDKTFEDILSVWYGDKIKADAARAFVESTKLISDTVRWRVLSD